MGRFLPVATLSYVAWGWRPVSGFVVDILGEWFYVTESPRHIRRFASKAAPCNGIAYGRRLGRIGADTRNESNKRPRALAAGLG